MNIFQEIEDIATQGYSIDYEVVDQIANGYQNEIEKNLKPLVTYTVYVTRLQDLEILYNESFDHIKDCLEAGIKYVKEKIMKANNINEEYK